MKNLSSQHAKAVHITAHYLATLFQQHMPNRPPVVGLLGLTESPLPKLNQAKFPEHAGNKAHNNAQDLSVQVLKEALIQCQTSFIEIDFDHQTVNGLKPCQQLPHIERQPGSMVLNLSHDTVYEVAANQQNKVSCLITTPGFALALASFIYSRGEEPAHLLPLHMLILTVQHGAKSDICSDAMQQNLAQIWQAKVIHGWLSHPELGVFALPEASPNPFNGHLRYTQVQAPGVENVSELAISLREAQPQATLTNMLFDCPHNSAEWQPDFSAFHGMQSDCIELNQQRFTPWQIEQAIVANTRLMLGYQMVISSHEAVVVRVQFAPNHEYHKNQLITRIKASVEARLGVKATVILVNGMSESVNAGSVTGWKAARIYDARTIL